MNNLQGTELINRMKELMKGKSLKAEQIKPSTVLFVKEAVNGDVYAIVQETSNYFIKKLKENAKNTLSESFDYIGSVREKNKERYNSLNEAKNKLALKLKEITYVNDKKINLDMSLNEASMIRFADETPAFEMKKEEVVEEEYDKLEEEFEINDVIDEMIEETFNKVCESDCMAEDHDKGTEEGLMVFPKKKEDDEKLRKFTNSSDYYTEYDNEGYWFFKEDKENYDSLEKELQKEFDKLDIDVRFEGVFPLEESGKGLWANIHAKRKRGEKPAKPGDEDYPDKKGWDKAVKASKNETYIIDEEEAINQDYTHFAIHKPTGKILDAWDYSDVDIESLKTDKDSYFFVDLSDKFEDLKKSDIVITSRKKLKVDPNKIENWITADLTEEQKFKLKVDVPKQSEPEQEFEVEEEPIENDETPAEEVESDETTEKENPFGDEKFDAGVDADEEADPKNYIEKLTGKLGQKLREYNEDEDDSKLNKFVINSIISALEFDILSEKDINDILSKIEENKGKEKADKEEPKEEEVEEIEVEEDETDDTSETEEETPKEDEE